MISVPSFCRWRLDPKIGQIVEHRDPRLPLWSGLHERLCSRGLGRELEMVNTAATAEDDLRGGFVAIVTSFCVWLYSRRRAKRKTEQVLAGCFAAEGTDL